MIKILLVDGYEVVRDGLRALIATEPGMMVLGEASDRQTAMELAKFHEPNTLVVDPGSLGHDGIPIIIDIKKINSEINVLVLTNSMDDEEVQEAFRAGARGFILKGTTAPDLIQAIRDIADGKLVLYHP